MITSILAALGRNGQTPDDTARDDGKANASVATPDGSTPAKDGESTSPPDSASTANTTSTSAVHRRDGEGNDRNDTHQSPGTSAEADVDHEPSRNRRAVAPEHPSPKSSDGPSVRYGEPDAALPSTAEVHQSLVGPSSIQCNSQAIRVDERTHRALWVADFPEIPMDGLFEELYAASETEDTDIAIHLTPRDREAMITKIEGKIETLEADVEHLNRTGRANVRGVEKDRDDYSELYDTLRRTDIQPFDVSMVFAVHDIDDGGAEDVRGVVQEARRGPANLTPVTPRWNQLETLISTSPIGIDRLQSNLGTTTPMLAGALGAMFPFVAGAFVEPGIEYGTAVLNESPVIVDRFNRETGYCMMVIGKLGAGKSFAAKLGLLRRAMFDPETVIVMLDPLRGFAEVAEALGGERITVGGTRSFNPLEIAPTPDHVLDAVADLDPWAEQVAWVMAFFETFFTGVAGNPLGERKQTLRRAVQEAYERRGITRDPTTHDRDSPTIPDVISVLEDLVSDAGDFGYETEAERESVSNDAQSLLKDMRPSFRPGGDLENLTAPTEFDLDANYIYLDLHQQEGASGRHGTSLMMQVLFNTVYERAKQSEKKVIFVIDEAHYLLGNSVSLSYLETAVRHSRHYDLSLEFITQTGGEFSLTPEARTIADLCSITMIHRVGEQAEKLASWFDLNERQVNWIKSARAGNAEDGFSEALLGLDEVGWMPIRVRASPFEAALIDSGVAPATNADGNADVDDAG